MPVWVTVYEPAGVVLANRTPDTVAAVPSSLEDSKTVRFTVKQARETEAVLCGAEVLYTYPLGNCTCTIQSTSWAASVTNP